MKKFTVIGQCACGCDEIGVWRVRGISMSQVRIKFVKKMDPNWMIHILAIVDDWPVIEHHKK